MVKNIKISQSTHNRATQVRGLLAFESPEDEPTFNDVFRKVSEDFLEDLPPMVGDGALLDENVDKNVKVDVEVWENLVQIRGYIEFKTGQNATMNDAARLVLENYLASPP